MKRVVTRPDRPATLTEAQIAQLDALQGREPDTSEFPEAPEENWRGARRLFKPRKEAVSIRLDADVLDWLKRNSDRYQSEINRILRKEMESQSRD